MANFSILVEAPPKLVTILGGGGSQGPAGASGLPSYQASVDFGGHTAFVLGVDGLAVPADPTNPTHRVVRGISLGAVTQGYNVQWAYSGVVEHLGWSLTPDQPVFLGLGGALVQVVPPEAVFLKVLGVAISSTKISLDFQPAIFI